MTMSDVVSDMLTRIRNALKSKHLSVDVHNVKKNKLVLDVLKSEGYIADYYSSKNKYFFTVELKYSNNGESAIKKIEKVSKPGKRVFLPVKDLKPYYRGMGTLVVSTSSGVVSDAEARKNNIGGEVICKIF